MEKYPLCYYEYISQEKMIGKRRKIKSLQKAKLISYCNEVPRRGVDVPRAEVGIFTSSTGNPRQFIQRQDVY